MLYPDDMDLETRTGVYLRKLVCWYIISASITYPARKELHIQNQREMYFSVIMNTTHFRNAMKSIDNPLDSKSKQQMLPKYSFVLLMAFEAAVKLQEWDSLGKIVQEAGVGQCSLRLFESIADLILCPDEHLPDDIALQTMQVPFLSFNLSSHLRNF